MNDRVSFPRWYFEAQIKNAERKGYRSGRIDGLAEANTAVTAYPGLDEYARLLMVASRGAVA